MANEHFPTWKIIVYSLGGIGGTVIGSLTSLVTYFYVPPETSQAAFPQYISTEPVFGLTFVGLIGYISGILLFFLGPLVASWSDRSQSRIGRRKIFMIASFLPISILSFLLFTPPVDHVSPVNAGYLLVIMLLLNASRTLYGVSGALQPELGTTSRIIMFFNTFGAVGWLVGFLIGSQLVFVIKEALMGAGMSPVDAFRTTVGGLIAVSTLLLLAQILVVDEKRYGSGIVARAKLLPSLKKALTNRTFVLYTFTQQVYFWGDGFFQAGLIYFITLIFGLDESMMMVYGAVILILGAAQYPLVNVIAAKTGKKRLFSIALLIMVVVMLLFAFADQVPVPKEILVWILVALVSFYSAITGVIPGAINAEIIREDCVRTGSGNEATFQAAAGILLAIPAGFGGLALPSLLILGKSRENPTGARLVAIAAAGCMMVAWLMLKFLYNEKKIQASLRERGYE